MAALCLAQSRGRGTQVPENQPTPRSTAEEQGGESSSRDTKIDLSAPPGEANMETESDVNEFHPYDPHRAEKSLEVGLFYLKRKNYAAAESRFREALEFKPNDAEATFHLAEALEKMGHAQAAAQNYAAYLKILPHGPLSAEAHKALDRIGPVSHPQKASAEGNPARPQQGPNQQKQKLSTSPPE